ncbi:3-oxoacyl-ACP synthase [Enterovibrio norvegicus FF-162]|uniref:3-oxoacyl-[acyl-carrier-protein] synthase III C-terminal domain-containing protein n=1 Tax=Enterovibrio norvegicus TaxID=188144 RepID=UPI0003009B10|nr:3-oxoacyl-ACP synthase [Enterovibrio norvegicus FF-162]
MRMESNENIALSIDAIRVVRPKQKLVLVDHHDAVHCTSFNAHILKKMMGIETVNVLPDGEPHESLMMPLVSLSSGEDEDHLVELRSANTGAMRAQFGQSIDRSLARIHNLIPLGVSNANRCVSLFKQLDMISRSAPALRHYCIHNGELAFSKEMRITRGLSVQGDSNTSLRLSHTDSPKIQVSSVHLHYDRRFARGIWGDNIETKAYEDNYRQNMHQVIHRALDKAGVTLSQIDHLLPHNINIKSWRFLCQSLDVPESRLFSRNIQSEGHCFCNDMVINLSDALDTFTQKDNPPTAENPLRFLAVAAGAGGMFGACVLDVIQLEGLRNERHAI